MKNKVLAISLFAAFTGNAVAQSSVTMYGIVDAGIVHESGGRAGSVTKLTSGIGSQSRFGFRGREDLGGGLSAIFNLEGGTTIDNGASTQGGLLFGRTALVGMEGGFGSIAMGRFFTPYFVTLSFVADPFATGFAGAATNLIPGLGLRNSNTVKYTSPVFGGFSGELAYTFGEIAGDNSAQRAIGAALAYKAGPLHVRIGHQNKNNDTAVLTGTSSAKNTMLAANYDFGIAKAYLGYGVNKGLNSAPLASANPLGSSILPTASTDSDNLLIGAALPMGANTVLASYIRKNDKTALNQDADQVAVGYLHALSKRTDLYTAYAYIRNRNGAGYVVGNGTESGSGNKAFNIGVRHTF